MLVRELIEELKQRDPEATAVVYDKAWQEYSEVEGTQLCRPRTLDSCPEGGVEIY